jgi:DNA-binding LacI/PurR family transcriptional regulator
MNKAALAAQLIEKRIAFADHVVAGIPSERQLAEELGLSRTTLRKALQQLMDQGTLTRLENGRLEVASATDKPRLHTVGFIVPAGTSANRDEWRESLESVVQGLSQQYSVVIRTITYGHWADPSIQEALAGFDGAFFMTDSESIPKWLLTKIKESACRVVCLDKDQSDAGLPSVQLFPPTGERKLFDLLYRFGHRRIDCLNTQGEDAVIQGRIAAWQDYVNSSGIEGQLHTLMMRKPAESAYQLVRDSLQEGRALGSALFCTTGPAAIGAMRALHEAGLKIGDDVSVCAVNSEGIGRYLLRSLTALEAPPRALYLRRACEWMLGKEQWQGPLLVQPSDVPLFEGESTGPAQSNKIVSYQSGLVGITATA